MPADGSAPFSIPAQKIGFSSRFLPSPSSHLWLSKDVSLQPRSGRKQSGACRARCSLETAIVSAGQVMEVNKDNFWPIVGAAGDKTVVLDMYTQWCGPCKVMAPKFQNLSEKYLDVVFLKLDCNHENRPLVKELGIRVVPTFKILKDSKIVKEVTGAKFDDLALAIETVRSS
ncbi:hypothetical protein CRG98_012676 [Punica granatum]|nr:hypothetical protein CRG98_012676 [Punica granatum]